MVVSEITIDSRDRDTNVYPHPNAYSLTLPFVYKDVYSLEIHRIHIPQSQWVVDTHNNILSFQYENEGIQTLIIPPCHANPQLLLKHLNQNLDPMYIFFTLHDGIFTIHNNFSKNATMQFSKPKSIGHILGFSSDVLLKPGEFVSSENEVVFQNESHVFVNLNNFENMTNINNSSFLHKHLFSNQHTQRQIKEFYPVIGKLFKLDISLSNYNNVLYNCHGYNHTFNLRIKHNE